MNNIDQKINQTITNDDMNTNVTNFSNEVKSNEQINNDEKLMLKKQKQENIEQKQKIKQEKIANKIAAKHAAKEERLFLKELAKEEHEIQKQAKILVKQAKRAAKKAADEKMCAEILLARQQKANRDKKAEKIAKKQAKVLAKQKAADQKQVKTDLAKQKAAEKKQAKILAKQKAAEQKQIEVDLSNKKQEELTANKTQEVEVILSNKTSKDQAYENKLLKIQQANKKQAEKEQKKFIKKQNKIDTKNAKKQAKNATKLTKSEAKKAQKQAKIDAKLQQNQSSNIVNNQLFQSFDSNLNINNENNNSSNANITNSTVDQKSDQVNDLEKSKIKLAKKQAKIEAKKEMKRTKIAKKNVKYELKKITREQKIIDKVNKINNFQMEYDARRLAKFRSKFIDPKVASIDFNSFKNNDENQINQNEIKLETIQTQETKEQAAIINQATTLGIKEAQNNITVNENLHQEFLKQPKQKNISAKKQAKLDAKAVRIEAKKIAKKNAIQAKIDIIKQKQAAMAIRKQAKIDAKEAKVVAKIDAKNKKSPKGTIKQVAVLQKQTGSNNKDKSKTKDALNNNAQNQKDKLAKKQAKLEAKQLKKEKKLIAKELKKQAKISANKNQKFIENNQIDQKNEVQNTYFNQLDENITIVSGREIRKDEDVVKMVNVSKTFLGGKVIANQNVNLEVKYNEIHAICGENGAGKSTLMSILFGLYKQDSGEIFINGNLAKFKNAADATKVGLGMVHQHFKLVQVYSLLDNIILGAESTKFGFLDKKTSINKIQKICDDYNLNINLKMKTNVASVGQQQRAEIIKLLYRGAEILIFDEPTAVLSDNEIQGFLNILLELKKQGKTIILISHKLNEVKQVADKITILRKGSSVGTYDVNQLTEQKIVELMVGNKMVFNVNKLDFSDKTQNLFTIDKLVCKKISNNKLIAIKNLSLSVNPGEILGIAGIEGNGQSELALAIAGLHKIEHGSMVLNKNNVTVNVTNMSPKQRSNVGIAHVPEDRHKYGLILDETVSYNLISNQVNSNLYNKLGFLRIKEASLNATNLCSKFDIKGTNRGKTLARSLSGGNQQKIVVAREMSKYHDLIVLAQPTRGLDVKAANFIHDKIIEEAKNGKAIILISYELDEIIKVCSKIAVMDQGQIVYLANKNDVDRQTIGKFLLRADLKTNKSNTKGVSHE